MTYRRRILGLRRGVRRMSPGIIHSSSSFVYVLEGEELLRPGDCAGFRAGVHDEHHSQNRSARDAVGLEAGSRKVAEEEGDWPDIDLRFLKGGAGYARKDGTAYPKR
jgi:uncharacterized cupin superfamily protein